MKIEDIMTARRVLSVKPEDDVMFAARLMSWAGVRHLPVCEERRVVGLFTEQDYLRCRIEIEPGTDGVAVSQFMAAPIVTARPHDPVSAVNALMLARRIGCVPVVDENDQLLGVLTASDILAADVRAAMPRAGTAISIREVMTHDPTTVRPFMPVLEAVALMAEHGFKHVPVTDQDGRLVGIITDRDIRTAIGDPAEALRRELTELEELPISTVMTTPAESTREDAPLVEVAHRLAHESIGALPVVDDAGRVTGIVSYVDVVRKLLDLVGGRKRDEWLAEQQPSAGSDSP